MIHQAKIPSVVLLAAALLVSPAAAADLSKARTFVLDNGLTVATLSDRSHPVVAVQALYKVGARNETPGITGIAHFLEHMLFRGTTSFGLADVTGVIERAGGEWHGYTYLDCTTYFEAAPRELLPTLLRLEAERMTAGRIEAEEVDPERGAVFQEYRGYQLDARSDLFDEVIATLFLQHPYRNNTMGWESDLAGITHEDLVAFYRRYYAPGNAVLSIVGDFDPAAIEPRVREAFGAIPPGGESTTIRTVEAPLTGQRRITIRRPGASPALMVSFLAPPPSRAKEYAALLVLDAVIGSAKGLSFRHHSGDQTSGRDVDPNSRMAVLGRSGPVERFGTALLPTLYPYHYSVYATPRPGGSVEGLEPLVFAALKGVADTLGAGEVEGARNRIEAALLLETDSPVEIAHELAFWTGLGGLEMRRDVVGALRGIGPDEVRALARSLSPDRAVVGWVLPTVAGGPAPNEPGPAGNAPLDVASRAEISTGAETPVRAGRLVQAGRASVGTMALAPGARAIVDARPGQEAFVLKVAVGPGGGATDAAATIGRLRAATRALRNDSAAFGRLADLGVRCSLSGPGQGAFSERDLLQVVLEGPAVRLREATETLAATLKGHLQAAAIPAKAEPSRDPEERALHLLSEALDPIPGSSVEPAQEVSIALVSSFTPASVKPLLRSFALSRSMGERGAQRPALPPFPSGRTLDRIPDIPQGRLLLAFPGEGDPEALRALTYVLHHSYSGRLGVKAIAEMGLVYSMDSEAVSRGRPLAFVTMGAAPEALPRLEAALSEVLDRSAATLTEKEVAEYRTFAAGDLMVRLADPLKAASLWCSALLRGEDHRGPAAAVERAGRLKLEEVAALADSALRKDRRLTIVITREEPGLPSGSSR